MKQNELYISRHIIGSSNEDFLIEEIKTSSLDINLQESFEEYTIDLNMVESTQQPITKSEILEFLQKYRDCVSVSKKDDNYYTIRMNKGVFNNIWRTAS